MAPRENRAGEFAMLKALLALLIVANLLFFAYDRGTLDGFLGLRSTGDREPERLANQVRPQTIRLLPSGSAASAPGDLAAPCYETPTFGAAEAGAVEAALAANLPAGAWTDNRGERSVGTRTEATHTYRIVPTDPTLAAQLTTLRLDAAGRAFGFSACARAERAR